MDIAIRYYTRGGNTKKLALAFEETLGVKALDVSNSLETKTDILFLGCSYYAFDMDGAVKEFLTNNKDNISKIVLFGTSAMIKSMKKPLSKVLKSIESNIEIYEDEFHCPGSFGIFHKGRPNENDINNAKEFATKFLNMINQD